MTIRLHSEEERLLWTILAASAKAPNGGSAQPEDAARHADELFAELRARWETQQ